MKVYLISILLIFLMPILNSKEALQECIQIKNNTERLACYDSVMIGNKTVHDTENAEDFGSEDLAKKTPKTRQPSNISSVAIGPFNVWKKNDIIKLSNGQQWQIIGSGNLYFKAKDPQVTISKSFFNSYFMSISGVSRKLKVKRIK